MAFDGIVIAGLVHELNQTILNTKISKIAQPENDELLLTCKGSSGQFRVSISANASLPFLYLTDTNKTKARRRLPLCMVYAGISQMGGSPALPSPYGAPSSI